MPRTVLPLPLCDRIELVAKIAEARYELDKVLTRAVSCDDEGFHDLAAIRFRLADRIADRIDEWLAEIA